MRYLVTGSAGFIGFHLSRRLLEGGQEVVGIDGLTPYYDVELKRDRHAILERFNGFRAYIGMLEDNSLLHAIANEYRPDIVIHLAAQAGVRYSVENPRAYIDSNIVGSFNVLEFCRMMKPQQLLMASTSSVYGANTDLPFAENDRCDHPLTVYAASKKAVEGIAHCYSHLWQIPTTVFRFFSVYGPWGRPDMAFFKFVHNILADMPIDVYNNGDMRRDFTYIDDLIEAIVRLCDKTLESSTTVVHPVEADSLSPVAPFRVVNIGGGNPVELLTFIEEIEIAIGRSARRNYMGMQPGDVHETEAATTLINELIGYQPSTPVAIGIRKFVDWYRSYYRV